MENILISEFFTLHLHAGAYSIFPFLSKLLLLRCKLFKNNSDTIKNIIIIKLNEVDEVMHLDISDAK